VVHSGAACSEPHQELHKRKQDFLKKERKQDLEFKRTNWEY